MLPSWASVSLASEAFPRRRPSRRHRQRGAPFPMWSGGCRGATRWWRPDEAQYFPALSPWSVYPVSINFNQLQSHEFTRFSGLSMISYDCLCWRWPHMSQPWHDPSIAACSCEYWKVRTLVLFTEAKSGHPTIFEQTQTSNRLHIPVHNIYIYIDR